MPDGTMKDDECLDVTTLQSRKWNHEVEDDDYEYNQGHGITHSTFLREPIPKSH